KKAPETALFLWEELCTVRHRCRFIKALGYAHERPHETLHITEPFFELFFTWQGAVSDTAFLKLGDTRSQISNLCFQQKCAFVIAQLCRFGFSTFNFTGLFLTQCKLTGLAVKTDNTGFGFFHGVTLHILCRRRAHTPNQSQTCESRKNGTAYDKLGFV